MKKKIVFVLGILVCLLLCACGENSDTGNNNNVGENNANEQGNNNESTKSCYVKDGILYVSNKEEVYEYITRVEITKDNWSEYYEDYFSVEHVVKKDDFGEITEEYDQINAGLRFKQDVLYWFDRISFKFDGIIMYDEWQVGRGNYSVREIGKPIYINNYATKEVVTGGYNEATQDDCTFSISRYDEHIGVNVENYNCVDAVGVIYILNVPEEISNGEKISDVLDEKSGVMIELEDIKEHFGD